MANSNEQFLGTDGFKPLRLPARGEDLLSGRQYYLDPVARCAVEDVYGLRGVPAIVECTRVERPATLVRTISTEINSGRVLHDSSVTLEEQHATFRAFQAVGRVLVFTVNLAKVTEMRPFYAESPKLARYLEDDENPRRGLMSRKLSEKAAQKIDLSILD